MAGFGSMKKINPVDEPVMDMVLEDSVSGAATAVEVSSSETPAGVLSGMARGRGAGRSVASAEEVTAKTPSNDLLADFAGIDPMPEETPVAKAAVVNAVAAPAVGGIESNLASMLVDPDIDALVADMAAHAGPSATAPAPSDNAPGDVPPADAPPSDTSGNKAAEETGTILDSLLARHLGDSHEILDSLLRSGLDDATAVSYANEFNNHFNEYTRDGLDKLDKTDKTLLEQKLREDEEQAARSGKGGGLISGLLSHVMPSALGRALTKAQLAVAGNQRRKLVDEHSGFADMMTNRIRLKLQGLFAESMTNVHNSANALARSVVAHNLAVMEATPDFRQAVEIEAQGSNRTVEEVLQDLGKGGGSEDLRKLMDDAILSTASDPEVIKAKKSMAERELVFAEKSRDAAKRLETMTLNDPNIDPKEAGDRLAAAYEAIEDRMPSPLESPEEKLKFAERMKAVAESMQEAIRALMETLASKFGAKP